MLGKMHLIEVHVGVKGDFLKVTADGEHFVLLMCLLVGLHTLEQFGEILKAVCVIILTQQFLITAFFEHHIEHIADDVVTALRADHGTMLVEEDGKFHAFFDELAATLDEVDEGNHRLLVEFAAPCRVRGR